jgi:chemotaxis signal transduction protein
VLVLFRVEDRQFGVDMPSVRSIHRAATLFPDSEEIRPSALTLDGEAIPLYDLASVLGLGPSSGDLGTKMVMLLESPENSLALLVDGVDNVISAKGDQIEPLPAIFRGPSRTCFPRVLAHEDDLIPLFDPAGMEALEWEPRDHENDTGSDATHDLPDDEPIPGLAEGTEAVDDGEDLPPNTSPNEGDGELAIEDLVLLSDDADGAADLEIVERAGEGKTAPLEERPVTETPQAGGVVVLPDSEREAKQSPAMDGPPRQVPVESDAQEIPPPKTAIEPSLLDRIVTDVAQTCMRRLRQPGVPSQDADVDAILADLSPEASVDSRLLRWIIRRVADKCKKRWRQAGSFEHGSGHGVNP